MSVECKDLDAVADGKIYISATLPSTEDQAGYEALTWTEVTGNSDLPGISGTYNDITFDLLSNSVTCHKPGQFNPGSDSFNFARSLSDAGQALVKSQFEAKAYTAFKLEYANGDVDYCIGYFQGTPIQNGTSDTIRQKSITVQWTTKPVEVLA